jgi:hypothetical protein
MYYTNILKRSILLTAIIFMAVNTSFSQQSYYHSPNDTIMENAEFNDVNVFNITQLHPTADTLYFKWYKQSIEMPGTWEASICDVGHCYTTLRDSGIMDPIYPGDAGLMSLHIDPKFEAGTATIRYTIFAENTPERVDTLTWIITASGPTGFNEPDLSQPEIINNGKEIICKNLKGEYSKAFLYNSNGRLLASRDIAVNDNELSISLQAHSTQIFILHLKGKRSFTKKVPNINKQ